MRRPFGAGTVSVTIPEADRGDMVGFIARLQEMDVKTDQAARVVINERTGTVVVGGEVLLKPCQVAQRKPYHQSGQHACRVSQPAPASQGQTVQAQATKLDVKEQEAFLMPVQGTSAASVAEALNKLKVTPRDMIAIFQALREAGAPRSRFAGDVMLYVNPMAGLRRGCRSCPAFRRPRRRSPCKRWNACSCTR